MSKTNLKKDIIEKGAKGIVETLFKDVPELKDKLTEKDMSHIVEYAAAIFSILAKRIDQLPDDIVSRLLAGIEGKYGISLS